MAEDLISWKSTYNLGLQEIDEQHRSLLDLTNKIWRAIVRRSDQIVVLPLLEELEKYTVAHFAAEETFMRTTGYPGFEKHKIEHQSFIERIAVEKRKTDNGSAVSLDLMHFLRDWLVDHIQFSDRNYAEFTQKNEKPAGSLLGRFFKRFF